MSLFDPNAILEVAQTEVNERREVLPEGTYLGIIGTPQPKESQKKDGTPLYIISLPIELQIPEELQAQGQPPTLRLKHDIILDLTPSGTIDNGIGKNSGQRLLREALDMNKPGVPFKYSDIAGQAIGVQIKHREWEGQLYEDVRGVVNPAAVV